MNETANENANEMPEDRKNATVVPSKKSGGIADSIAAVTGVILLGGGLLALFLPVPINLLTGLGSESAADIIAAQWSIFGLMMLFGGSFKMRTATVFAAEFLLISSVCALGILAWQGAGFLPVGIQASIAVLAFVSSSLGRITEKVEMTRDLKLSRQEIVTLKADAAGGEKD